MARAGSNRRMVELRRVEVVTAAARAQATQYTTQGLAAQDAGDYDAAIGLYSKAYELVPHPLLLFNLAQANRLAGRIDQALAFYQRYLDAEPQGAQAKTAREFVAELNARKAEDVRKADEARKTEEARKAEEARAAEARGEDARKAESMSKAQPPRSVVTTAPSTELTSSSPAQTPGRNLRLAGLATGSVGVVSLIVGTGFGVRAHRLAKELSTQYDEDKTHDLDRANVIAGLGWVGGAVLVGAGATLYWLGHTRDERKDGVVLAPLFSEQLTGLVVSGPLP